MKIFQLISLGLILSFNVVSYAGGIETISQQQLLERINAKTSSIILDVRSEKVFNTGHVPGAVSVPYNDYKKTIAEMKLNKSHEIIVYCEAGFRANLVEVELRAQGFENVLHLEGDMGGWRNAGLPIEQEN